MSASYIHRDPVVLNQNKIGMELNDASKPSTNDFLNLSALNHHHHHRHNVLYEELSAGAKPSSPVVNNHSQQHSPKMSPDSTLSHHNTISRFHPHSPRLGGGGGSSSASSSTCESFLRSALLSDSADRSCVGNSNNQQGSHLSLVTPAKCNFNRGLDICNNSGAPNMPLHTTANNISPSSTKVDFHTSTPPSHSTSSASVPSSTTPVKKSSRRNPWGSETYSDLITVAIHSYPDKQATLQQIYDFIIAHYDYFRERSDPASSAGWKNSIRHNLSLHDRFTKCPKSSDNTKSSYWRINTEVASKPYVRRRACSMDGSTPSSLKRSAGCGKNGRMGVRSAKQAEKLLARAVVSNSSGVLPSLSEIQSYLTPMDGSHYPGQLHQHKEQPGKMQPTDYFPYGGFNAQHHQPHPNHVAVSGEASGMSNGTMWKREAPSSPSPHPLVSHYTNPCHMPLPNRLYSYDHWTDNMAFDEFHASMGSTDQALVRSRANSLIEHLLRADTNPTANLHVPSDTHFSQSYLPNAFFGQAFNPSSSILPTSAFHPPTQHSLTAQQQQHPMRHRSPPLDSGSTSSASGSRVAVGSEESHLRPVYPQSTADSMDATPSFLNPCSTNNLAWQNNYPTSQLPCNSYSPFGDLQPPALFRSTDLIKPSYDPLPMFQFNPTTGPILAPPPPSLSPSTSSSTSSSTRSWRPCLGSEALSLQPDSNRHLNSTALFGNHLIQQSISASGYQSSLTSVASVCPALDTPPSFPPIKVEQPLDEEMTQQLAPETTGLPSSVSTQNGVDSDTLNQTRLAPYNHSAAATPRYTTDYAYATGTNDDVDRDKLELELSLELAERIVASTRSTDSK